MENNLRLILKEYEQLKGQHILAEDHKVYRLIGIGKDAYDYYYILYNGIKFSWHSCVGHLIPLKGKIDKKDYNRLLFSAKLNHHDQPNWWNVKKSKDKKQLSLVKKMNKEAKEEFYSYCKKDKQNIILAGPEFKLK